MSSSRAATVHALLVTAALACGLGEAMAQQARVRIAFVAETAADSAPADEYRRVWAESESLVVGGDRYVRACDQALALTVQQRADRWRAIVAERGR
ncbi:MAG TPA: hypothetical protein VF970_01375 [Gemmatimonadales bacterium]